MTAVGIFLGRVPRMERVVQQIGVSLALACMFAAAVAFYLYAYLSVVQLQQISPDQLLRALSGA